MIQVVILFLMTS